METATQTLHRATSYACFDEESVWDPPVDHPLVVRDFEPNDLEHFPWFYKRYDGDLPTIALPRELPMTTASAVDVLAGTATIEPGGLDLGQLARLLHLSSGVVRTSQRSMGTHLFRAAGSAGGRFPLEVYAAVPEGTALPAGVHWYHPQAHALVQVGPAPHGEAPMVVVTGVPWRTGWRYRERGYRHIYWDAGTMLSQLLAAASSAGIPAHLYSRFPDAAVSALVGADGVHEWPVAVVSLGATSRIQPTGSAVAGEVDAAPHEFPLETAAQRAGDLEEWGEPWPAGAPADVRGDAPTVERVILARGSQRLFDPHGTLPADVMCTSLQAALRGVAIPHVVAVHAVDGFTPGLYRATDLSRPERSGHLRDEMHRLCMDQGLARDAAFVVVAVTDVSELDDREYRDMQLAAGVVEGRLHLLAYAQGASASGMTFVDGHVASLTGAEPDGLLVTCLGVPQYRSTPGGLPGQPVAVGHVMPRS